MSDRLHLNESFAHLSVHLQLLKIIFSSVSTCNPLRSVSFFFCSLAMRKLVANRMGDVTDWHGRILSKRTLNILRPGCIVRVIVDATVAPPGWWRLGESLYFEIVKIKDGTLWGVCLDTY